MVDRDTSPEAHRVQLEVLRRMGPGGRAQLALDMSEDMRRLALERIAATSPDLDERGRLRALAALFYGEELAARAFPVRTRG